MIEQLESHFGKKLSEFTEQMNSTVMAWLAGWCAGQNIKTEQCALCGRFWGHFFECEHWFNFIAKVDSESKIV